MQLVQLVGYDKNTKQQLTELDTVSLVVVRSFLKLEQNKLP